MDRHAGHFGTESEARRFPWTSLCLLVQTLPSRTWQFKIDIFLIHYHSTKSGCPYQTDQDPPNP